MPSEIEMGTVSSRGQIAIPSSIRNMMGLEDGSKVLFFAEDDTILMKKVTKDTFAAITRPLKRAAKKSGLSEKDVVGIVHRARR